MFCDKLFDFYFFRYFFRIVFTSNQRDNPFDNFMDRIYSKPCHSSDNIIIIMCKDYIQKCKSFFLHSTHFVLLNYYWLERITYIFFFLKTIHPKSNKIRSKIQPPINTMTTTKPETDSLIASINKLSPSTTYSIEQIKIWNTTFVIDFLKNNIEGGLDDEDLYIIEKNKIDGVSLLQLTEEKLEKFLPLGPAIKIGSTIEKIKKNKKATHNKTKRSFSSYKKLEEVFEKYKIKTTNISRLPSFNVGRFEIKEDDEAFQHCLKEIKLWLQYMGSANEQNEAARCEFISAILLAAMRYFKNLLIFPQFEIIGEEETGRVDYAINQMRNYSDEELICITEGKQSDIKTGIGQNILQLDSAIQVIFFIINTFIFLNYISA